MLTGLNVGFVLTWLNTGFVMAGVLGLLVRATRGSKVSGSNVWTGGSWVL